MATILRKRWCLESLLTLSSKVKTCAPLSQSSLIWLYFRGRDVVWNVGAKKTFFLKYTKTPGVLTVFGHQGKDDFKNSQKLKVFDCFMLNHFGSFPPHLDRSRRDLDLNTALSPKNAPLCSRLLVFLTSAPSRAREPGVLRVFLAIMKMSATLTF